MRSSFFEIGPVDDELDVGVLRAAAADGGDRLHRRAQVRRRAAAGSRLRIDVHDGELIARALLDRLQPDVDVAEVARLAPDRRRSSRACSPPRAAAARTALAMRLVMTSVDSRLVPSGARRLISNSDWSSCGMKFLFADHEQRHARQQHEHRDAGDDRRGAPSTTRASACRTRRSRGRSCESFDECSSLPCLLRPSASAPTASASA